MAISHTYCDFATGNDYKGATFTDGSFDSATLTLTKTGAFTDSQLNHWLYLRDNGSGEVTLGYYRITTVTSDDAVVLDADIRSGANDPTDVVCTQHDGTTTLPWRSVQGALDLTTQGAGGDQFNIKAGTSQIISATLNFATYGAPTQGKPVIIRGYTTAANDGGMGVLDRNAGTTPIIYNTPYIRLIDLRLTNTSSGSLLSMGTNCTIVRCQIDTVLGAGSGAYGITGKSLVVMGCYFYNIANLAISISSGVASNNYIVDNAETTAGYTGIYVLSGPAAITANVIRTRGTGIFTENGYGNIISGNVVYGASTSNGIRSGGTYPVNNAIINNIICCFSNGVLAEDEAIAVLGHNAFYNNIAHMSLANTPLLDLTANDVVLTNDPFVDAANGDFSLTAAAKAALAGKGFPTEYLGAHANTVPNITIGAIQQVLATSGGGFPKIASVLGRTRM